MLELNDQDLQCQAPAPKFKIWKPSAWVGCLVAHMEQDVIFNLFPSGTVLTSLHFAVLSLRFLGTGYKWSWIHFIPTHRNLK